MQNENENENENEVESGGWRMENGGYEGKS
ncbi:hypothetical protein K3495_g16466 [Podosphaera aphanis]|nr:hypothetical protein K3495_g16466 [Podosphaera aphanis]